MAEVQIWYHSGFAVGGSSDSPLPKEPPIGYQAQTVSTSNVSLEVSDRAQIAVIETDAAVAYRVNSAAVYANDPIIPATSNVRYVIDVSSATTLNLITGS